MEPGAPEMRSNGHAASAMGGSSNNTDKALHLKFLRRGIRLIHCIQKERGGSCALASSGKMVERQELKLRNKTLSTDTGIKRVDSLANLDLSGSISESARVLRVYSGGALSNLADDPDVERQRKSSADVVDVNADELDQQGHGGQPSFFIGDSSERLGSSSSRAFVDTHNIDSRKQPFSHKRGMSFTEEVMNDMNSGYFQIEVMEARQFSDMALNIFEGCCNQISNNRNDSNDIGESSSSSHHAQQSLKRMMLKLREMLTATRRKIDGVVRNFLNKDINVLEEIYSTYSSFNEILSLLLDSITTTAGDVLLTSPPSSFVTGSTPRPRIRARTLSTSSSKLFSSNTAENVLMGLLVAFVQLKESSGIERALCCMLLSVPDSSIDQIIKPKKGQNNSLSLFNELAIRIESQRGMVRDMRIKAMHMRDYSRSSGRTYKSLLSVIEGNAAPPEKMEEYLDYLRDNFDLVGLRNRVTAEQFWNICSSYIERLHAIELLILEELDQTVLEHEAVALLSSASLHSVCENNVPDSNSMTAFMPSKVTSDLNDIVSPPSPRNYNYEGLASSQNNNVGRVGSVASIASMTSASSFNTSYLRRKINIVAHEEDDGKDDSLCEARAIECHAKSLPSSGSLLGIEKISFHGMQPSVDSWRIELNELEFRKRLGAGGASTAYLANWVQEKVCVKVASVTTLGLEGWKTEVESLKQLHHPNIIRLLGAVYHPEPLTCGLVLEYCNLDDLSAHFDKQGTIYPSDFFLAVGRNIASGMVYLHSRQILHRDIKPENVLLTGEFTAGKYTAKLSDFGVAKLIRTTEDDGFVHPTGASPLHQQSSMEEEYTAETGTYRYMAPEVIRHEKYNKPADVYSFAILMWQLLTREEPYANYDNQVDAAAFVALEQGRPPFPSDSIPKIQEFIEECWAENPTERPSFDTILQIFRGWEKGSAVELGNGRVMEPLTFEEKRWVVASRGHAVYKVAVEEKEEDLYDDGSEIISVRTAPVVRSGEHRKSVKKQKSLARSLFTRNRRKSLG